MVYETTIEEKSGITPNGNVVIIYLFYTGLSSKIDSGDIGCDYLLWETQDKLDSNASLGQTIPSFGGSSTRLE